MKSSKRATDTFHFSESTSWESMSTKQKHLPPGCLALTRRTFLSSKYAKGSKAFKIVSTVVVGFTFFMIIAAKKKISVYQNDSEEEMSTDCYFQAMSFDESNS